MNEEQMRPCPRCGQPMTYSGAVDTPPIAWQLRGYVGTFYAERWCCVPCAALFDYRADGTLWGEVGTMDYQPVETKGE